MKRDKIVPSEAAQLHVLTQFLKEFCSDASLPETEVVSVELALEEVFMNVVMHGSPADRPPRVDVQLEFVGSDLTVRVRDDGPAFDPLSLPAPDVTARVEERRVGGLGVFLVRQMMDSVRYDRVEGHNQLQMTKRLGGGRK